MKVRMNLDQYKYALIFNWKAKAMLDACSKCVVLFSPNGYDKIKI